MKKPQSQVRLVRQLVRGKWVTLKVKPELFGYIASCDLKPNIEYGSRTEEDAVNGLTRWLNDIF